MRLRTSGNMQGGAVQRLATPVLSIWLTTLVWAGSTVAGCTGTAGELPIGQPSMTPAQGTALAPAGSVPAAAPSAMPAGTPQITMTAGASPAAATPIAGSPEAAPAAASAAVSYHKSIRPIMQQRCVSCHFMGGAGGFPLTTWSEVQAYAPRVAEMVASRQMPPWLADATPEDCVKLADDQRLSDEQLSLFSEWKNLGFPEGLEAEYVEPGARAAAMLGEPSMKIQSAQPQPLRQNWEQYIDTPMEVSFPEDTYVVAIDVRPETEAVVHHAIVSIGGCTALGSGNIYSYRPGSRTVVFGQDAAMLIPAGSTLCTQFHYNTLYMGSEIPTSEHSTLRLWTMPAGQRPKYLITRHPNHILNLSIPVGVQNQEMRSMISASSALNTPRGVNVSTAQIVGLSPHMHALGVKFSETMYRSDGSKKCLINIPKWNWEWQIDYMYETGIPLQQGDRIEQICTYSNTPEQQLLDENGQPLAPRLTTFGEGTRDEMCLGYIWMRYETM